MIKHIPNILTIIRLLSPIVIIFLFINEFYLIALLVFIGAILTDLIDGIIARKFNAVSQLGKNLDAITDKIFILSIFFTLVSFNKNLLILFIFELLIAIINIFIWKDKLKNETNMIGKVKATFLYLTFGLFIFTNFINNYWLILFEIFFIITIVLETFTVISYFLSYLYQKKILENHIVGFNIFKGILTPVFKFYYRPKVINAKFIPQTGPVIIAGNHRHLFDQCLSIPATKRMIHYMAKKEYFDNIKTKWFFEIAGCIPVDRKIKDVTATETAIDILNRNQVLGIFPEGTRNKTTEVLLPFKFGTVSLAKKTNATIVPFAIRGTYKKFKNDLVIEFGKPFKVEDDLTKANEKLEKAVRDLYLKGVK